MRIRPLAPSTTPPWVDIPLFLCDNALAMPVIELDRLSKSYQSHIKELGLRGSIKSLVRRQNRQTEAVRQASFSIQEGELVGFLGPNGAGKTTTLKMLSGLLHPSSGMATVAGYVPWQHHPGYPRRIRMVMGNRLHTRLVQSGQITVSCYAYLERL